ncbi:MAG: class I SAM-dependent methyltransferase [Methanomassiliicoccaceae archaeon]|nr:class I SAM-dependent methyltransferase [Methanomassiliicoccaceae archaeon]
MTVPDQKDAWNELYHSQPRPWRGVTSDTNFPFSNGGTVLDIGCGNGKTSLALIDAGHNVIGIDISDAAVRICEKIAGNRMSVMTASATDIPLNDATMDGVVMIHVLEHLDADETERAVKEAERILTPGGKVLVRVFHRDDMRSDNGTRIGDGTVVRGNGIRYHYFTEEELGCLFASFSETYLKRIDSVTKFGERRSQIEAVYEKNG